jgi:heptosyltransferase-2
MLTRMPEVDNTIRMPLGHGDLNLPVRWRLGRELAGTYDWAITQPNSLKSALIPLFAGIKKRTGWKGESRYGLLNDLRSNKTDFPLMVDRYRALAWPKHQATQASDLPELLRPQLQFDVNNRINAISNNKLNQERPILALCPGAEFGPAKRWPEKHYSEVAKALINKGWQVWLFGSAKDQPVAAEIINQLPQSLQNYCYSLAGDTSLGDAIDLMSLASAVVSNDSGLMHIAAALGRPLAAVYGSSSPLYTPPLCDKVAILHTDIQCRPCFQRTCPLKHLECLTLLMPDRVIDSIDSLTQEN